MEAKLRGNAHKYGKNVDTDVIIPGKYCNLIDPVELGKHALEGLDPEYVSRMKPGDIIVADTNFGCGSSREVAPIAIKGSGTSAVIAKSFARIFYRNALNIGLPAPSAVRPVIHFLYVAMVRLGPTPVPPPYQQAGTSSNTLRRAA